MATWGQVATTAVVDGLLKELYPGNEIYGQHITKATMMGIIQTDAKHIDFAGREAVIPLQTQFNQGIGARGEDQDLPRSGRIPYENTKTTLKYNYGRIKITTQTMKFTKERRGAFADEATREVKQMSGGVRKDLNRQVAFGLGDGIICLTTANFTIPAVGSTVDVTVDNVDSIVPDMLVDVDDGTDSMMGARVVDVQFTDVGPSGTITLQNESGVTTTTGTTVDSGATVRREGVTASTGINPEMMGIAGIVDDYSTGTGTISGSAAALTLQGIVRNTVPGKSFWNSRVFGSTTTLFSEIDLEKAITWSKRMTNGMLGDLKLVSNLPLQRAYYQQLRPDLRGNLQPVKKLDSGYTALSFMDLDWIVDEQWRHNLVTVLDVGSLCFYEVGPPFWMDEDGAVFHRIPNRDGYEATFCWYAELGASRVNHMTQARFAE